MLQSNSVAQWTSVLALLFLLQVKVEAFLPKVQLKLYGGPNAKAATTATQLRMAVQTPPPKTRKSEQSSSPSELPKDPLPLPEKFVGPPQQEDDNLMWKVDIDPDDMLALADRTMDTLEDAVMHLRRAYAPRASITVPRATDDGGKGRAKPRLVVLGTGWGGHAISKVIDVDKYEVVYVSPRNYFIFTPLLAASSVGTVDVRSITESIRMANPCVNYVQGEAVDILVDEKKVVVSLPPASTKKPPDVGAVLGAALGPESPSMESSSGTGQ
ncbi:unnamed protein product, partial [Discosporangium mesarthrocarpum]